MSIIPTPASDPASRHRAAQSWRPQTWWSGANAQRCRRRGPRRFSALCTLAVFALAAGAYAQSAPGLAGQAGAAGNPLAAAVPFQPVISRSLKNDVSPPLTAVAPKAPNTVGVREIPLRRLTRPQGGRPFLAAPTRMDAALQLSPGSAKMPLPILNFNGVSDIDSVLPPDTNGDVGPNHYVQWVNLSFAVWDKSGNLLYGPVPGNTLWAGFGGACESTDDGDPIVQYDQLADRWLMSQLAIGNGYHQCIAISQTGDPTGAFYRYDFLMSNTILNDYPKFGVWPDAYYMSINQFDQFYHGQGVVAFERDQMLAGRSASMVYLDLFSVDPNLFGMLPSDLDGMTTPPPGSPNYFVTVDDDAASGAPVDRLQIWKFHVDWASPGNTTFTGPQIIDLAAAGLPFDSSLCGFESSSCIPQPGGAPGLDPISDRLMYRLAYRNFGTHESLVLNHTVDVDGTDHAGIRWYEIRDPGGSPPTLHQAGTYAGDTPDGEHRWMGSIAMDGGGNIALGYSASSITIYPSVRYVGRLATDPLSTLPQGETELIAGAGSQLYFGGGRARWGDYSMMAVDPVDDHTFWYTQEYYDTTSVAGWKTRIGSFRFVVSAGVVSFDHATYSCAASVGITVWDSDLIGTGTLGVTVATTGGDAETVTLTETPARPGSFTGTIATNGNPVVPGNAALEVADGDTLTVTYHDANHGNGNPATVQATAPIDCIPPVVANVAAVDLMGTKASITFGTNEAAAAQVRYGTSCASLTQTQTSVLTRTTHRITLSQLAPLTQYFFVIDATDTAGNPATDDNAGACYAFTTPRQPDYFTQLFAANDNDLQNLTVTFTPNGSADFYSVCRTPASVFPVQGRGRTLSLGDDDSKLIKLTGSAQVWLYGTLYGSFFVGSNGYVTFGQPDYAALESLEDHFSLPRIAAFFHDLNPRAHGRVSWLQLADRVVVTFADVQDFATSAWINFQIEMFFNKTIRITYLANGIAKGLAGLSRGSGVPIDYVDSDLSAYTACITPGDHFMGYGAKIRAGTPLFGRLSGISLVDEFGSATVNIVRPRKICSPADENGQGVGDASTHLEGYQITTMSGSAPIAPKNLKMTNALGDLFIDTTVPDLLLVPTAEDPVSTPPAPNPAGHNVDHYKCYGARTSLGMPRLPTGLQVNLADQFSATPKTYTVTSVRHLCVPANMQGEGIKNPGRYLMCYRVRLGRSLVGPGRFSLFVNNELGPEQIDVLTDTEFCVPSGKR